MSIDTPDEQEPGAERKQAGYWSPTMDLRHVVREVNDGNGDFKTLALQQRWVGRSWEFEWRDVEIDTKA